MKKYICLFLLLCSILVFAETVTDTNWNALQGLVNQLIRLEYNTDILTAEQVTLNQSFEDLTATLTTLQNAAQAAADQAATVAAQQTLASMESNLMLRGKLNTIINNTATPFSIALPDGTRIAVAAQSQVALNLLFSTYSEGGLVGGVISIIPQFNGSDIASGNTETQSVGLSYSLTFNLQGLNESGYAYGALNVLSVTRTYPSSGTRAHSLDLSKLVQDNELWAVDIVLNYVPGLGDGATFIYPRWSTLYKNTYNESDTSTVPDITSQTTWATEITVDESSSSVDFCFPAFTGDASAMWGDMTSQD